MTSTANVAIVPMIHNALLVIVETNCVIAPALGGAVPFTPAARNACACAIANTPYAHVTNAASARSYLTRTHITTDLLGRLTLSTAETPDTRRRCSRQA